MFQSPIPPQYVLWYHNDKMMNYEYETSRALVTVTTEPGQRTHSKLIINNVTPKDSGNYTCRSSNAEPDTTYVFVSHGKCWNKVRRYRRCICKIILTLLSNDHRRRQHGCNTTTRFLFDNNSAMLTNTPLGRVRNISIHGVLKRYVMHRSMSKIKLSLGR